MTSSARAWGQCAAARLYPALRGRVGWKTGNSIPRANGATWRRRAAHCGQPETVRRRRPPARLERRLAVGSALATAGLRPAAVEQPLAAPEPPELVNPHVSVSLPLGAPQVSRDETERLLHATGLHEPVRLAKHPVRLLCWWLSAAVCFFPRI